MLMYLISNLIFKLLEDKISISDVFIIPIVIVLVLVIPLVLILDIVLLPIEFIIGIIAIIKSEV